MSDKEVVVGFIDGVGISGHENCMAEIHQRDIEIERLRARNEEYSGQIGSLSAVGAELRIDNNLLRAEAGGMAKAIDAADVENERLSAETARLTREVEHEISISKRANNRLIDQDTEIARLRAALESIFANTSDGGARLVASEALKL